MSVSQTTEEPKIDELLPMAGLICIGIGLVLGLWLGYTGSTLPVAAVAGIAFFFILLKQQVAALTFVIMAQVMIPIYVGVPLVPGLPPLPPSLLMALVLATITFLWAMLDRRDKLQLSFLPKLLIAAYALSVSVVLFSVVINGSGKESINVWGRSSMIPFMVFLTTVFIARSTSQIQNLFNVLLIAAMLAVFYAGIEFILGKNILIESFIERQFDDRDIPYWTLVDGDSAGFIYRAHSVFTNPLFFGTFLSMIAPYPILRFVKGQGEKHRYFFIFAAIVCVLGVFLTFSRGPMLGLFLSLVALSVFLKSLRKVLVMSILTCLLCLLFAWPWIGAKVADRFSDIDNVSIRFKLWESAVHMYLDNPVLGVGLGNFPQHQLEVNRNYRIGPFNESDGDHIESVRTADSLYLQYMAEMGTAGVLAALFKYWLLALIFTRLLKNTQNDQIWLLNLATTAAVVAYLINGLTITAYQGYSITIFKEMFFAFGIALYSIHILQRDEQSAPVTRQ